MSQQNVIGRYLLLEAGIPIRIEKDESSEIIYTTTSEKVFLIISYDWISEWYEIYYSKYSIGYVKVASGMSAVDLPYVSPHNMVRKLFLFNGFKYKQVSNIHGRYSDGNMEVLVARIIDEYKPPAPVLNVTELKVSRGSSILHSSGKSVYSIGLRLIFPNKEVLTEFLAICGNTAKYYDELGNVYVGYIKDSVSPTMHEGGKRYIANILMVAIRKEEKEDEEDISFTDLTLADDSRTIVFDTDSSGAGSIDYNFSGLGIVITHNVSSSTVDRNVLAEYAYYALYNNATIRNNFDLSFEYNRVVLTPKTPEAIATPIIIVKDIIVCDINVVESGGDHYAKTYIEQSARAGIVNTLDKNGNPVFVFRPENKCKRSEAASLLNRMFKYVERMVRS